MELARFDRPQHGNQEPEWSVLAAHMEFLTLVEARSRAGAIRSAFDALMQNRALARRKAAAQWQFFRICVERTLGAVASVPVWKPLQVAQYKFEVEDRLRRLYLRGGAPVAFVFRLVSRRDAWRESLVVDEDYPEIAGYYLLVRARQEATSQLPANAAEVRARIEMVVAEAANAEFEAYRALPVIDPSKLLRWFDADGPAYLDLMHTLTRVAQRGWILTNPQNPSTRRLLAVKVKEIRETEATVRTTEYWYLRWWSTVEGKYRYPYRETDRETYILKRRNEDWVVEDIIRPAPRSSTPHRQ